VLINQADLDMQQAAAPKVSFVSLGYPETADLNFDDVVKSVARES
jgi:hypothetical protein